MLILTLLIALATTAALAASATLLYRNRLQLRRIQSLQAHEASRIQRKRMDRIELKNRRRLMEETVHEGTTAVEALHRTITGVTFDLVDRYSSSDDFKAKAQRARDIHDDKTRSFYRAVRTTNRTLHVLSDMLISGRNGQGNERRSDDSTKR